MKTTKQMQPQFQFAMINTWNGKPFQGQGKHFLNSPLLVDTFLQSLEAQDNVQHGVDQDQVSWLLDLKVGKQDVGL